MPRFDVAVFLEGDIKRLREAKKQMQGEKLMKIKQNILGDLNKCCGSRK